jgi:hypothetical protein
MTRKPSTELCCSTINRIKRQRENKITCVYLTAIRSRVDTEENEKLLEIRSDRMSPKMMDTAKIRAKHFLHSAASVQITVIAVEKRKTTNKQSTVRDTTRNATNRRGDKKTLFRKLFR